MGHMDEIKGKKYFVSVPQRTFTKSPAFGFKKLKKTFFFSKC